MRAAAPLGLAFFGAAAAKTERRQSANKPSVL